MILLKANTLLSKKSFIAWRLTENDKFWAWHNNLYNTNSTQYSGHYGRGNYVKCTPRNVLACLSSRKCCACDSKNINFIRIVMTGNSGPLEYCYDLGPIAGAYFCSELCFDYYSVVNAL